MNDMPIPDQPSASDPEATGAYQPAVAVAPAEQFAPSTLLAGRPVILATPSPNRSGLPGPIPEGSHGHKSGFPSARLPSLRHRRTCRAAIFEDGGRYQTAKELADDLRRSLNRFAISARRAGPLARAKKWVKLYPALSVAGFVILISLTVAARPLLTPMKKECHE